MAEGEYLDSVLNLIRKEISFLNGKFLLTEREFPGNYEYWLKYIILPLAVICFFASVIYTVVRSKEQRETTAGEQYIYFLCFSNAYLSTLSIILLTKIYVIDDTREYMPYFSGILRMILRGSSSVLVSVMALSAVFMSLTRFLIVSYPLKADRLLKKWIWIPLQCIIVLISISVQLFFNVSVKLIKVRTKSRITRNLIVDAYYPEPIFNFDETVMFVLSCFKQSSNLLIFVICATIDVCIFVKMRRMSTWRQANSNTVVMNYRFLRSVLVISVGYSLLLLPNLSKDIRHIIISLPYLENVNATLTFSASENVWSFENTHCGCIYQSEMLVFELVEITSNFVYFIFLLIYHFTKKSFRNTAMELFIRFKNNQQQT